MSFSHRQFGMEFEHISQQSHSGLADELTHNGVVVDPYATGQTRCREGCYSGWQVKVDGSISPSGDYDTGIELVSPPMTMKQSKQLRQALRVARQFGRVNSSCGLHIHVHAPELQSLFNSEPMQNSVSAVWNAVEKTLFSYLPPSRRMSDYCRGGIRWGEKYQAFNTTPLGNRSRTVEFRLHNSTLNPDKALSFAAVCIGLVERMVEAARQGSIVIPLIDPKASADVPAKRIKTRHGGQFYLLRADGKWVIESPKLVTQVDTLKLAFDEYKKPLKLSGEHYLRAFHYPHFGNAMSRVCEFVGVNGVFRGYAEDRYDRMVRKYGTADVLSNSDSVLADEEDYYNEPDYDPADDMQEAA